MERIELWDEGGRRAEGGLSEAGVVVRRPAAVPDGGPSRRAASAPAWFVRRESGTVVAYDLEAPRLVPEVVPDGRPVAVAEGVALVRRAGPLRPRRADGGAAAPTGAVEGDGEPRTGRLPIGVVPSARLRLVVGDAARGRGTTVDGPLRVGRDPRCELRLHDPHVSRLHLLVEPAGPALRVRDLGSENGTYCDGRRVHVAELHGGQSIRVGRTTLHLVEELPDAPLTGCSPGFLAAVHAVDRIARTGFPVLLLGETGVGKEALARRVHARSARASGPFVAWNAATLGPELADSQLFGHARGAFTGATGEHRGAFDEAQGGTLFLDELGELPPAVQARLLRVLEDGVVRPVGGDRARSVDVRIVAATHRDLPALVRDGRFRADLYHRLALAPVVVPPLRARPEDLAPLADALLARHRDVLGVRALDPGALAVLQRLPLPGNVRELRNLLVRAALACPAPVLDADAITRALEGDGAPHGACALDPARAREAVEAAAGNVARAARQLGLPRSTLRDLLRRREEPVT